MQQNDNKWNPNANNGVSWSATLKWRNAHLMVKIYNERVGGGENGTGKWDRQKKNRRKKMLIPIIFIVLYIVHGKCG